MGGGLLPTVGHKGRLHPKGCLFLHLQFTKHCRRIVVVVLPGEKCFNKPRGKENLHIVMMTNFSFRTASSVGKRAFAENSRLQ